MFISVLTKDNMFYIYSLGLERKFNIQKDKYSYDSIPAASAECTNCSSRHMEGEDADKNSDLHISNYETLD